MKFNSYFWKLNNLKYISLARFTKHYSSFGVSLRINPNLHYILTRHFQRIKLEIIIYTNTITLLCLHATHDCIKREVSPGSIKTLLARDIACWLSDHDRKGWIAGNSWQRVHLNFSAIAAMFHDTAEVQAARQFLRLLADLWVSQDAGRILLHLQLRARKRRHSQVSIPRLRISGAQTAGPGLTPCYSTGLLSSSEQAGCGGCLSS